MKLLNPKIRKFSLLFLLVATSVAMISFKTSESACLLKAGPYRTNGLGAVLGIDGTGGSLSGGTTCAQCHSGGNYSPTINLVVRDAGNNIVSSYQPGQVYTLEYTVAATSGSPAGYGIQSVSLKSNNSGAGSIGTIITANTQKTVLGGIDYLEHFGPNAAGFFSAQWTAPLSGSGTVSFYAIGLAVNGNNNSIGDSPTAPAVFTLPEAGTASISYSTTQLCANSSPQTPFISGVQGGAFSSTAGLSIDPNTGVINVSASSAGTYVVTYTYGTGSTTTTSVSIDPTYSMNSSVTICEYDTYQFGAQTLTVGDTGVHVTTLQSVAGCDSVVTLTLSATTIDTAVAYSLGQFTSAQSGATYQWLDCNNGNAAIAGEMQQSFVPSQTGSYAVVITLGNCTEQSSCKSFVGLEELDRAHISIYPNPSKDNWVIEDGDKAIRHITLKDLNGKNIRLIGFTNSDEKEQITIQGNDLPNGCYVAEIETLEGIIYYKLIRE